MVDQCSTNRSQAAVRPGAETLSGENGQANRTEEAEEQIMSLTKNRTAARGQFFVLDKINETEQRRTKTSYFWTATSKAGRTTHEAHKHEKEKATQANLCLRPNKTATPNDGRHDLGANENFYGGRKIKRIC
jgi:hypothetical protein